MKAQLGRPTGLALALLATLLATFLAMGVFPVAQANSHNAERSFSTNTVESGGTLVVTITVPDHQQSVIITDTLPEGFVFQPGLGGILNEEDERKVGFVHILIPGNQKVTSSSYTVTAPTVTVTGVHTFDGGSYHVDSGASMDIPDSTVTVAAPTNGENGDGTDEDLATTKTTPGSNQSLRVRGMVLYGPTDNITVNLEDFGVPSSIDPAHVLVTQGGSANPTDVEIDGTKVTLIAPFDPAGATPANLSGTETDVTTIDFRRAAGITLPIRDGDYYIKVSTVETMEDVDGVENKVNVEREITVSPTSGTRGTEVTISGKGFSDGTADIMIGGDYTINADVDDGAFTVTVDSAVKNNAGNSVFDGSVSLESGDMDSNRVTDITISDADTKDAPAKTFEIKPSFTFAPESPTPGQDVTINLVDISGEPTSVKFTGAKEITDVEDNPATENIDEGEDNIRDSDNDAETLGGWKVQVPGNTRIGNVRVTILHPDYLDDDGDMIALTKTITIGTNDLTVTPTTVVPRQTISIDGGGFTVRGTVDLYEVVIGGKVVSSTSVPMADRELINNNGDISFDVAVPQDVTPGTTSVKVTDSGDRVGTASITVATAELTISPAESLRGETITVSGTGFPANDLVLIKYNDATVDTSSTSPTGTFEQEVMVPAGEDINPGGTYTIEAVSQVNSPDVSAQEDHEIRAPVITLSPDAATPGSNLTISGENFKGFLRVSLIEIGGQNVTPVPAPQTDKWGAFTTSDIQVPQLNLTRHAVKVVVGDEDGSDGDATEFLTLVGAVVSNAPADVFASLGDRLVRVWYLDRATQVWSFYDPDLDVAAFNTLTEVSSGQNVSIIISAGDNIGFQDKTLYPGTNPIALD